MRYWLKLMKKSVKAKFNPREILIKISPNKAEQKLFKEIISSFLKKINSNLKEAKAILGGSGAKDTWLSYKYDIDIFVAYDYPKFHLQSAQLSDLLQPCLKKSFLDDTHG